MDSFERRLKTVPLACPSAGLKRRIFQEGRRSVAVLRVFRRRISIGWAAMFALVGVLAGLYVSQLWSKTPMPPKTVIQVQIIRAASGRNVFDFSEPAADFLPGQLTGRIETPEEI